MNHLWGILFLALPLAGIGYCLWHVWHILPLSTPWRCAVMGVLAVCIVLFFSNFALGSANFLPLPLRITMYQVGTSSLFILLYAVMLFLLLDLGRVVHLVPPSLLHHSWKGTLMVGLLLVSVFTYGYFHYMDKVRQPISLTTGKALERPLKIVMMSDLHIGYHNRVDELNRWIDLVNKENPDLILVGGDIIDGDMRPVNEMNMAESFRRLKAPVVACTGNHEFYSGIPGAEEFYKKAGIRLLRDEAIQIKGINIVARDDRTNRNRKPLAQLMKGVDRSHYTILLDHQPFHLEEAEQNGVDFQFSGHTHYGQLWPISWITNAIYEDAWGPLTKGNTQYHVSSGIGIWGAKFRIGTRSEYLVATLAGQNNE